MLFKYTLLSLVALTSTGAFAAPILDSRDLVVSPNGFASDLDVYGGSAEAVDTAVATATAAGAEVTVSSSTRDNAYDISISWALGRCWC